MNRVFITYIYYLFFIPTVSLALDSCSKVFLERYSSTNNSSFLYNHFLKKPQFNSWINVSDNITQSSKRSLFKSDSTISINSDLSDRFNFIKDVNIENIIAAPGHRKLRNQKQVKGLVDYIKKSNGGDFSHDHILLNIVLNDLGAVDSIDLWNAHHRLVAYLEAGYTKVKDLPLSNLNILVNGQTTTSEKWGHYLSISGVDTKRLNHFDSVHPGDDIREGTISVPGQYSNYSLGSRNTLGQLRKNTLTSRDPKIGIYFGTFDPIHEGHIQIALMAKKEFNFDQIVFVPNMNPIHKKNVSNILDRNNMISRRIENIDGLNLYTGNSSEVIDNFGRNPFFERITQSFGSYDLHQIIGDDSFLKLLNENQIDSSLFRKYIVFKRTNGPSLSGINSDIVTVSKSKDELGLSSSLIRKKLRSGEKINSKFLNKKVLDYIRKFNLYQ